LGPWRPSRIPSKVGAMEQAFARDPSIKSATAASEVGERRLTRGRIGGALGLAAAALLLASFRWAHHWGPSSVALVASWALATISAFVVSVWSLRTSLASRRFALVGLALALLSVLALPVVAALYAAGIDAADACGGG
jgi:hypothetical protein